MHRRPDKRGLSSLIDNLPTVIFFVGLEPTQLHVEFVPKLTWIRHPAFHTQDNWHAGKKDKNFLSSESANVNYCQLPAPLTEALRDIAQVQTEWLRTLTGRTDHFRTNRLASGLLSRNCLLSPSAAMGQSKKVSSPILTPGSAVA